MKMHVSFVFFFKQKTADEVRISDWSSNVGSSDLGWHRGPTSARTEGCGERSDSLPETAAACRTACSGKPLPVPGGRTTASGTSWSSGPRPQDRPPRSQRKRNRNQPLIAGRPPPSRDRKRAGEGKSVDVRAELGGQR